MQIGIFSVGDVTADPTTGRTPTEHERIKATVAIAKHAEEVGLDVFATGEHHNPPFVSSNPTATLAYIGAQTERIILSTSTTLITTTDPVLIAEDYAKIQHLLDALADVLAEPRVDRAGVAAPHHQVDAAVEEVVASLPDLADGGSVALPYVTHAFRARRP